MPGNQVKEAANYAQLYCRKKGFFSFFAVL